MAGGYLVHGEAILDGDSSGGVDVILYEKGSTTVRTLATGEFLHICHVQVGNETGSDTWLVSDSKAAGRYVYHAVLGAKGRERLFMSGCPYTCPRGKGLKFYGASTNLNTCIIEGFITEG